MNSTIEVLKNHRSIRKFSSRPVEADKLEAILDAAQAASTSSNMQAYSIIGVSDPATKIELAQLAGNQSYVEECPLFLVWCADLYRLKAAAAKLGTDIAADTAENFLIATVDASLAAQNAAVAAESLGLGIVYIGGIRNHIAEASRLLALPELVYPVFGMCVGYPDHKPILRPRLPREAVYHADRYDPHRAEPGVEAYDELIRRYMGVRGGGKSPAGWSEMMAERLRNAERLHLLSFLQDKGLLKR